MAFYRRFNVDPSRHPPSPLNDPTKERRSLEPFASFFFSRGTQQWWTEDGPDGRHGRCAAQTARTPGEDPVTSRHPATVDDLARGGTPAWRIAPAACATVSHEIPFPSTCHDSLRRPIGSYPREKDTLLLAYRNVEPIRKWRSSFLGRIDDNRWWNRDTLEVFSWIRWGQEKSEGGMLDRLSWLSWTLEVRGVGRISIEFHRVWQSRIACIELE